MADSSIGARREIISGLVGAAVSVVVLLAVGFAHDALVVGITIGGSALAAAVLVPAGELVWNWLQAPMRLLTEDVIAIRARLDAVEIVGARPKPTIDVRLQLLNYKRKGEELVASSSVELTEQDARRWTDSVIEFLSVHMHESVGSFIAAGEGSSSQRMAAKLAVTAKLSDDEGQRAGAGERAGELGEDRQIGMEPDAFD